MTLVYRARCRACGMETVIVVGYPVGSHGEPGNRCREKDWEPLEEPRYAGEEACA